MKRILRPLALTTLLALAAAPAWAQASDFDLMDTNHDNSVTFEEMTAEFPEADQEFFDSIDANKDGKISIQEWEDAAG